MPKTKLEKLKLILLILAISSFFGIVSQVEAEICEAIQGHHCWYVAPWGNDSNEGSFERPFRTVQHGFDVLSPGDYLYMRDGTYNEHVEIRPYNKPQGNQNEWYTVKSYPGEWAILNPNYSSACPVINYGINSPCGTHGDHNYDFCPKYWRFENFEVTGGGIDNTQGGSGIRLNRGYNLVFNHLYIHDNRGSSASNNGGIVINTPSNTTIEYSYLKDNACSDLHNCGNIVMFSDYKEDPADVEIEFSLHNNTIRYNLIEGSAVGLKYKNSQWLSLDHTGTDMRYKTYGDKIYRNIFINQSNKAILGGQDFYQIYENVFDLSESIDLGDQSGSDREPFYACFYNNLLIKTRLSLSHDDDDTNDNSSYEVPEDQNDYHPHFYAFNNIFENIGQESNGHNDINIFFTWSDNYQDYLNMSTVFIENNLFVPKSRNEEVINIGDNDNDFSIDEYIGLNHSSELYSAESTENLHVGSSYKINNSYRVDSNHYISNAGIGGQHPYLQGVNLPSYIGPCSDDDCYWIDQVTNLRNLGMNITIRADVNQDNQITSTDALLTLRKSLGLDMSSTNWVTGTHAGDVNCDNTTNSTDAMLILRKSLGLNMETTDWCGG